jgi:hypothetical protein
MIQGHLYLNTHIYINMYFQMVLNNVIVGIRWDPRSAHTEHVNDAALGRGDECDSEHLWRMSGAISNGAVATFYE